MKDIAFNSLRDRPSPFYYMNYLQRSEVRSMTMFVRTSHQSGDIAAASRRVVREVAADVPITNVRWMDAALTQSVHLEFLMLTLVVGFAILALTSSAVGLYGVVSYIAARRRGEIGIRMALGATSSSVARMVLRDAVLVAGTGVLIGVPAALATGRLLQSQLFGVVASDREVMLTAVGVLLSVALGASFGPVRRASAVQPASIMRSE